jgi:hypothetical protein
MNGLSVSSRIPLSWSDIASHLTKNAVFLPNTKYYMGNHGWLQNSTGVQNQIFHFCLFSKNYEKQQPTTQHPRF